MTELKSARFADGERLLMVAVSSLMLANVTHATQRQRIIKHGRKLLKHGTGGLNNEMVDWI